MRILNIIASMSAECGGPAQGIRNIMPHLAQEGCEVEVLCLDAPEAMNPPVPDGMIIHRLGPVNNRWAYTAALEPWLLNQRARFDLITVHGLWLYPSFAVWKSVSRSLPHRTRCDHGQRSVPGYWIFPHGMLDPWFQNDHSRRLKAVRNWLYWRLIEHRVVRDAEGLLFTCESELKLASTSFRPYQPKREINVGYGIQDVPPRGPTIDQSWTESFPQLVGKPFWLFLGRIDPKKGVNLLISAYARLLASNPHLALPDLVIAGPVSGAGYGEAMQQLATLVPDGPCGPRIHFPGLLLGDAKWGAFHACEAFILPSHQENFGIAVVEALACSKPVLISDQVNIWREIHDDGAAFVENDTEVGTLALLKRWMTLSESDKASMGARARSCFERRFEATTAAQRLLEVLTESLQPTSAERPV